MNHRLVVGTLVALTLVVTGCGDGDADETVGAGDGETTNGRSVDMELALEVTVEPDPPVAGAGVTWVLSVTNRSNRDMTLTFPSAQRGDVTLSDGGDEASRWSEDMAFTQAIEEVTVAPGASLDFELAGVLEVEPGTYDLRAELTSDPGPPAVERSLEVVAG